MNSKINKRSGFTVLELFVVVAMVLLLATVLLENMTRGCNRCQAINCTNNQKQIGLAFKTWAIDNQDLYPMQLSTNQGGTLELTNGPCAFAHFQVMSNELSTPKVLLCPLERKRSPRTNFDPGLSNSNVSYFMALDVNLTNTFGFLCGDRTITNSIGRIGNLLVISTNQTLSWTLELHKTQGVPKRGIGNLTLNDGSVQQLDAEKLNEALKRSGASTRLAIP